MNIRELLRNERIVETDLLNRIESNNLPLDGIDIDALNLSTRSYNALTRNGIDNIRKLVCLTDSELAKIPNVGVTSLQEIVRNTNEYLERISKPEETERLLKISLFELLKVGETNINSATSASLAKPSLGKQIGVYQ